MLENNLTASAVTALPAPPGKPTSALRRPHMLFTTSWDDGHPLDERLADLLAKHGFQGTFYVPLSNLEGLPVMDAPALRQLDAGFEIGSHTLDHCYANTVSAAAWAQQVRDGKIGLEQLLGHRVAGFCYPGGKLAPGAKASVRAAGFDYARTVMNLNLDGGQDRFLMPTTLQMYPHGRGVLVRNWLRGGAWSTRTPAARLALRGGGHAAQLRTLLDAAIARDGVFHLWGHSWELEQHGLWPALDQFLALAASLVPVRARVSNAACMASLLPRQAVCSVGA